MNKKEHLKILLKAYPVLIKNRPTGFDYIFHDLLVKHIEEDINGLTRLIIPPPVYDKSSTKLTVEEFKKQNPLRETIEKYLIVNKYGFTNCPFHKEKTASFKIYNNGWHCFGCNEGGDIIEFLMRYHKKSFNEILNGKNLVQ